MVTVSTRILKDQLSKYLHRAETEEKIVVSSISSAALPRSASAT